MSHDIRNINQIGAGFIELALGSTDLPEDEKELLEKPLEAFQRSTDLIANVRKLQRTSGALTLERTALAGMLREVAAQYANVKDREISIGLEAGENCCVRANPLLREVFANTVGNAIKHSEGRIGIGITLRKITVAGKTYCEVTVEDDGPGIPDELKPRLFSVKKLAEKGGRRRGLGLILARSLLDDFDGKIRVEDRVPGDYSKGARFVVTLPAIDECE